MPLALTTAPKLELLGLSPAQLRETFARWNEPTYRADQTFHALHRRHAQSLEQVHELPKALRARLEEIARVAPLVLTRRFDSEDGTRRYLFALNGGEAIEAVWIPEADRATICLSSQAGCPLGCEFCLTAKIGLQRNLTPAEILGQVTAVLRDEHETKQGRGEKADPLLPINLVLMGMGEPLLNYDNVMSAVRLAAEPDGLNIRPRNVTLSTAGIVPRIRDLGRESVRPRLALSLSAPNDELRDRLMPINTKYPLSELMSACLEFPLAPGERITFEYVMLDGVNDSERHARELLKLTAPLRAKDGLKVNLIPHNPAPGLPFRPSPDARIETFRALLRAKQVPVFVRRPRGRDISAACGQLAAKTANGERWPDFLLNS